MGLFRLAGGDREVGKWNGSVMSDMRYEMCDVSVETETLRRMVMQVSQRFRLYTGLTIHDSLKSLTALCFSLLAQRSVLIAELQ